MLSVRLFFILSLFYCWACQSDASIQEGVTFTSAKDSTKKYINYTLKAKDVIDSLKLDKRKIYIQIDKSKYMLSLKVSNTTIKSYPVVLGFNPTDDKMKEGDGCTPEGTFKIRSKYPHKSWNKFIWIDYPTAESWKKFRQRKKEGVIPKNAKIGGEIGIHGVPKGGDIFVDLGKNWTLGCISLKNADVDEVYSLVKAGTKIVIDY